MCSVIMCSCVQCSCVRVFMCSCVRVFSVHVFSVQCSCVHMFMCSVQLATPQSRPTGNCQRSEVTLLRGPCTAACVPEERVTAAPCSQTGRMGTTRLHSKPSSNSAKRGSTTIATSQTRICTPLWPWDQLVESNEPSFKGLYSPPWTCR
jgi:hypothetical protein